MTKRVDPHKRKLVEEGLQELASAPLIEVTPAATSSQADAALQAPPPLGQWRPLWHWLLAAALALPILAGLTWYWVGSTKQAETTVSLQQAQQRLASKAEMEGLIKNCAVRRFALTDGKVKITYQGSVKDAQGARPSYADGQYYNDYVAAAKAAPDRCGEVPHFNLSAVQQAVDNCTEGSQPWQIARQQTFVSLNANAHTITYQAAAGGPQTVASYCALIYVDPAFAVHLAPTTLAAGKMLDVYTNGKNVYLQDSLLGDTRPKAAVAAAMRLPASDEVCVAGHPVATITNVKVMSIDEIAKTIQYQDPATNQTSVIKWCGSATVSAKADQIPYPMLNPTVLVDLYAQDGFVYGINTQ